MDQTTHAATQSTKQFTQVKPPAIDHRTTEEILRANTLDCANKDAFFVADLSSVVEQAVQWRTLLPRVQPFYAVKCNPDNQVILKLAEQGCGFDCASKTEIEQVVSLGVQGSRIIYANPCKQVSHLHAAAANGVSMLTFDNADELAKIKEHHPQAQLVLRILTDDSYSVCRLGTKFGAGIGLVPTLLKEAQRLNLNVIGISYHVGSGCYDASAFVNAAVLARKAFDIGASLGFNFSLLDIGGGFPGKSTVGLQFPVIAAALRTTLDELFPPSVHIISEPGRYFVSAAFTLAVSIIARRRIEPQLPENQAATKNDAAPPTFMYYMNDGMYGSFNCLTFDTANPVKVTPLVVGNEFLYRKKATGELFESSLWGPTCDSIDCISKSIMLPKLEVGDWLYVPSMGAYTTASASAFNGFQKTSIVYREGTA